MTTTESSSMMMMVAFVTSFSMVNFTPLMMIHSSRSAHNHHARTSRIASHTAHHHHIHHHHVHHHHSHHHTTGAHTTTWGRIVISVPVLSVWIRLLDNSHSCSCARLASTYNSLWNVFTSEMNSTSWHTHPPDFNPLLSTLSDGEEIHRDFRVTDHLAAHHVLISHFDEDFVVHVEDFELEELELPHGVSSTLEYDLRAFFTIVDADGDEGGHPFEEASIIVLEIRFYQVEFEFSK